MNAIVDIIVPVFGTVAVGWLLGRTDVASVVKVVVMPLMVWLAGRYLFTLDPLWLTVATLNAAMPAGANVYLVAQLYRTGVGLATNAVVISTAASIFTLSAALLLLGVESR